MLCYVQLEESLKLNYVTEVFGFCYTSSEWLCALLDVELSGVSLLTP